MAATACEASDWIEIVAERRRAHNDAFCVIVVAEALRPGARAQEVARRQRICPSLVYRWRRLVERGQAMGPTAGFVPVSLMPMPEPLRSLRLSVASGGRGWTIRIELADGVCVSVDAGVSATALRRMMSVLRG